MIFCGGFPYNKEEQIRKKGCKILAVFRKATNFAELVKLKEENERFTLTASIKRNHVPLQEKHEVSFAFVNKQGEVFEIEGVLHNILDSTYEYEARLESELFLGGDRGYVFQVYLKIKNLMYPIIVEDTIPKLHNDGFTFLSDLYRKLYLQVNHPNFLNGTVLFPLDPIKMKFKKEKRELHIYISQKDLIYQDIDCYLYFTAENGYEKIPVIKDRKKWYLKLIGKVPEELNKEWSVLLGVQSTHGLTYYPICLLSTEKNIR